MSVVYAWGRGDLGQLGVVGSAEQQQGEAAGDIGCVAGDADVCGASGSREDVWVPTEVSGLAGREVAWVGASGDGYHAGAVMGDGEVYVWGASECGQLGLGGREGAGEPRRVAALEHKRVVGVAMGEAHTCCLTEARELCVWGNGEDGQLGLAAERLAAGPDMLRPQVHGGRQYVAAACGARHTVALTGSGEVHSCGGSAYGQLGHGNCEGRRTLGRVAALAGAGVVAVACGTRHSVCAAVDGRVYAWGCGKHGQHGQPGSAASAPAPVPVAGLAGIVAVAAGGDVSAAVDAEGRVFLWGRGAFGQLGPGAPPLQDSASPVLLDALPGPAAQVAVGLRHCVALLRDGSVYSWGAADQGQLGRGPPPPGGASLIDPTPRRVAFGGAGQAAECIQVAAGADVSFALFCRPESRPQAVMHPPDLLAMVADLKGQALRSEGSAGGKRRQDGAAVDSLRKLPGYTPLLRAIVDTFSCPAFLNRCFQASGADAPRRNGVPSVGGGRGDGGGEGNAEGDDALGLDSAKVVAFYADVVLGFQEPELATALLTAGQALLDRIGDWVGSRSAAHLRADRAWLRALLVLLLNPLNAEISSGVTVSALFTLLHARAFCDPDTQRWFMRWVRSLGEETLGANLVHPLLRALEDRVRRHAPDAALQTLANGLAELYRANLGQGGQGPVVLPKRAFVSGFLSNGGASLRDEYLRWVETGRDRFALLNYPFLLSAEAKGRILVGEAMVTQAHEMHGAALRSFFEPVVPYLVLIVRRDDILQTTAAALTGLSVHELRRPMRIKFELEEGVDEGGVLKEFFQIFMREAFRPEYGLFVYDEGTRTHWFAQDPMGDSDLFGLVGLLVGLAVYNNVILDLHFPRVVYKKLLLSEADQTKVGMRDLRDVAPQTARGLEQLLAYEPAEDVETAFGLTWTADYECFGSVQTAELCPGGASRPVTGENRADYVKAYIVWRLTTSTAETFGPFREGFNLVAAGPALTLFRPEDLELCLCGLPHYDFEALQKVCAYEGGYSADHETVKRFWRTVHGFKTDERKLFLAFVTGCPRAPVAGLGACRMLVQRAGPDSESLPTAHTCFNILMLPDYTTEDKLRAKLTVAINQAEGFGLQ